MKMPKSVKKCLHAAKKAARRFGPAVGAQVAAKCMRKSGVSLDGIRRRRKSRRKGRR